MEGKGMARLSGVDAISPAMETTKRQLFSPFRFGRWARLAVVCLLTGEITGGGGWGGPWNVRVPRPHEGLEGGPGLFGFPAPWPGLPLAALPWIILGLGALVLFLLLFIYITSIYRFILFDSVLHDRCQLQEGWRRWQVQGQSYFLWTIAYMFASLTTIGVAIGAPVVMAWRAGIFKEPERHVGLLVGGGALLLAVFLALLVLSVLGNLFAKDFVVPVMALENVGVLDGWRRVLPMLGAEKGAYSVYVLMKMVLAIGAAVAFAIADFLVLLALLIPLAIAAVAVFPLAKGMGLGWTPWMVGLAVLAGIGVLLCMIFVVSLVSAPPMVFFQAYTLHFFGSRYPLLGEQLAPQTPPAPPPLSPPAAFPEPAT